MIFIYTGQTDIAQEIRWHRELLINSETAGNKRLIESVSRGLHKFTGLHFCVYQ